MQRQFHARSIYVQECIQLHNSTKNRIIQHIQDGADDHQDYPFVPDRLLLRTCPQVWTKARAPACALSGGARGAGHSAETAGGHAEPEEILVVGTSHLSAQSAADVDRVVRGSDRGEGARERGSETGGRERDSQAHDGRNLGGGEESERETDRDRMRQTERGREREGERERERESVCVCV